MRQTRGNDGFTMVEMVITLAITAILLTMLAIAISAAIKSTRNTNNDAIVQNEAQVALNQLTYVLMEAEAIEAGTIITPDKKYLVRSYEDNVSYVIYLKADEGCLYLLPLEELALDDSTYLENENMDNRYKYLLAKYVHDFNIEKNSNCVNLTISFVLDDIRFTGQKTITMRNK